MPTGVSVAFASAVTAVIQAVTAVTGVSVVFASAGQSLIIITAPVTTVSAGDLTGRIMELKLHVSLETACCPFKLDDFIYLI